MEIKITNFLGVASVSIPLTTVPVAVIGHNACGKTSIATAIAAILSRNYNPLSIGPTKRPYMRDDADNGEVTLVGEGGSIFRQWVLLEKGIRVLPGGPEDISKHVLGLIDFIAAPAKYRVEAWETCFLPEPKTLVEMVGNELREATVENGRSRRSPGDAPREEVGRVRGGLQLQGERRENRMGEDHGGSLRGGQGESVEPGRLDQRPGLSHARRGANAA